MRLRPALRKDASAATEIQTLGSRISTPQVRCQSLSPLQRVLLEIPSCPPNHMFPNFPLQDSWVWHMNYFLNVFYIQSIDLLRFGKLGYCFPSARDIVLRKMMKFHHPLDFSYYYNLWALFMSDRERQKVNGTSGQPLIHSQRLGSLVEASNWTLVKDEQDGGWLSISVFCLCWSSLGRAYSHRLDPSGWAVFIPFSTCACSPFIAYLDLQNGHQ